MAKDCLCIMVGSLTLRKGGRGRGEGINLEIVPTLDEGCRSLQDKSDAVRFFVTSLSAVYVCWHLVGNVGAILGFSSDELFPSLDTYFLTTALVFDLLLGIHKLNSI